MQLYGYFRSSAAFRVRITLNLKGLDHETILIHLRRNEQQSPDYSALNPQQLVPTLVEDGSTLTQSQAIIEYLDETHPQPPLLPTDPIGRARVRSLAAVHGSDIHPINNLRVLRYLSQDLGQDAAAVERWYNHWIAIGFSALETRLAREPETGRFCHGDQPGLADVFLLPQWVNARRYPSFDFGRYPTLQRIADACLALPAFADAMPANQPDYEP